MYFNSPHKSNQDWWQKISEIAEDWWENVLSSEEITNQSGDHNLRNPIDRDSVVVETWSFYHICKSLHFFLNEYRHLLYTKRALIWFAVDIEKIV